VITGTVGSAQHRHHGALLARSALFRYADKFSVPQLKHLLKAKAVLCPGLTIKFLDEATGETQEWCYEDGLKDYLSPMRHQASSPACRRALRRQASAPTEAVDWALCWLPEGGECLAESYVNLIPTAQGGTHVNGLRSGPADAMREFCEFRNLLPRGVKLAPEDVWDKAPTSLGQDAGAAVCRPDQGAPVLARERPPSSPASVKDAFSLWLNQHTETGEQIAEIAISRPGRMRAAKTGGAQEDHPGPGAARQAGRLHRQTRAAASCSWWRVTPPAARPSRRATADSRPSCRCAARS
jgi:topoisomerase-4 subunit B